MWCRHCGRPCSWQFDGCFECRQRKRHETDRCLREATSGGRLARDHEKRRLRKAKKRQAAKMAMAHV